MRRIPKGVAVLLLVAAGALAIVASMASGTTRFSELTPEIVRYRLGRGVLAFLVGS